METKLKIFLHELNPQGKSSSKRNNFFFFYGFKGSLLTKKKFLKQGFQNFFHVRGKRSKKKKGQKRVPKKRS